MQPPQVIHKSEEKTCHPPMGLAYLAAYIRKEHSVAILDAIAEGFENEVKINSEYLRYGLDGDGVRAKITQFNPDIVGVSCLFSSQIESALGLCAIVKGNNPRALTVLGGAHPSSEPEEVLSNENVDYVVIGEGEAAFMNLLNYISTGDTQYRQEGLGWKDNHKIVISPARKVINNLDEIPFPAWDLLPLDRYFSIGLPHGSRLGNKRFLPMITSRGCPFECCFCSIHNVWGRGYRKRSTENIISEMEWLRREFNIQALLFEDDNLTIDRERANAIFEKMIEKKFDYSWSTPNGLHADSLDKTLLEKMKRCGCRGVSIAVESGDPYILRHVIRKRLNLQRLPQVVRAAKKLGLETSLFFVVGLPAEGKKELIKTFKLARKLLADYTNYFFATPLPGTELLNICRKNNLITGPLNYLKLRATQAYFENKKISTRLLRRYIRKEKIILNVLQLFFRPRSFFKRTIRHFFN